MEMKLRKLGDMRNVGSTWGASSIMHLTPLRWLELVYLMINILNASLVYLPLNLAPLKFLLTILRPFG